MPGTDRSQRTTLAGWLLFFSGLSALVYRTIWSKQLALVVGVDNAYYDWFFGRVRGGR